jgi:DNA repair protein RecN (Recombination protein N)
MTFQLEELTSVGPKPDEDEQIIAELRRAESSEHVVTAATALREALYTGTDTAYDRLSTALRQVDALTSLAPELARFRDELEAAMTLCREAAQSAAPLADPEDFSAERIEDLRTRLMLLQRLIRKYGSLQEARATQERLASAVNAVEHLDEALEAAHQAMSDCMKTAKAAAAALSKARKAVVPTLTASVTTALHDMGMPSARVEITHATGELRSSGIDEIEVLFTGNAGESPRPLTKVASGGELSRVMLAIKRAMAVRGAIGTMVFDEIDTGISGKVARHVGEVMKDLSTQHQILCITHLPQIASLADHVIRVSKQVEGSSTTVSAERIYGDDAVLEVARLMSGVAVTDAAIDSARDLMTATKR